MEGLEAEDPDLVEQIRRLMFVFEDILLVNDKGIQSVLKEVDNEELALALKTASQELKDKIFKNMSERAAQLINEDMQYMGPVRVSDVEAGAAEDRGRRAPAGRRRRNHHRRPRRREGNGRVERSLVQSLSRPACRACSCICDRRSARQAGPLNGKH